MNITAYLAGVLALIILLCSTYAFGRHDGAAQVARANAVELARANASVIEQWRAAAESQSKEDAARRAADRALDAAAAETLSGIRDKFQALASRPMPKGSCALSADWVKQYNEAR